MDSLEDVTLAALRALRDSGMPYALAGGLAANSWVRQEDQIPTFDFDAAILLAAGHSIDVDRFTALVSHHVDGDCFPSATLRLPKATIERFLSGEVILDLIVAREDYARMAMTRVGSVHYAGEPFRVLSPEDTVLYKALARRQKDIGPIQAIAVAQGLNLRYIEQWARKLGVWGFVKRALRG